MARGVVTEHPCWLGKDGNYSRISTCLALSQAVYAPDAESCVKLLNGLKYSMYHGINELLYSINCKRQYLIALKTQTKEIYVTFRGTDSWKALLTSFQVYAKPNTVQGTFHAGYYEQARLIPLAPFFYLLNKFQGYKLIFNGHSLGGAIATLVTVNMLADLRAIPLKERIYCIAFGSPFIGNEACSEYINARYQDHFQFYVNRTDIIPYLLTFVYNASSNVQLKRVCKEWLETLALCLTAGHEPLGITQKIARRLRRTMRTVEDGADINIERECRGLTKYLIETCRSLLKAILPEYKPFGCCYRTKSDEENKDNTVFSIERVPLEKFSANEIDWDSGNLIIGLQDHYIKNYIAEIYTIVIARYNMVPFSDYDCPEVQLIQSSAAFPASPLYLFLLMAMEKSVECERGLKHVIHCYLLITALKCEYSNCEGNLVEPGDSYDESVRLFVVYLPIVLGPFVVSYEFSIVGHFGTIDLSGVFDRKNFTLSDGMQDRKKQIADLSVFELYKLAFAYCAFTGDAALLNTGEDCDRRKNIETKLLLCENLLKDDCKKVEEQYLAGYLNKDLLKELGKEISYVKYERKKFDTSSPYSSDNESEETTTECSPFSFYQSQRAAKESPSSKIEFVTIKSVLKNWYGSASARSTAQTAQTTDSSSNVLRHSTEAVAGVVPRLFCMMIALTREFNLKFDIQGIQWYQIGWATVGGIMIGLGIGYWTVAALLWQLSIAAAGGTVLGGIMTLYHFFKTVHTEYLKILSVIAESLGVDMDQVRQHQYCLEERISSKYSSKFKPMPDDDYIYDSWENFFPCGVLKELNTYEKRKHCLTIVKCINANFQMRTLLTQDFAVGVVGPGKTGKSKLVKGMFGFDTNPDKNVRTTDLCSYRVTDEFRIVDFPHLTAVVDAVKNCFICNHTLVNAIIVVLNSEQGGNDRDGEGSVIETVKVLAKEGVDVLYIFNRCDKIALDSNQSHEPENVDKFSMYKRGETQHATTTITTNKKREWTEKDVENKKLEWAKNYNLDPNKCWMTFCDVEAIDQNKELENFQKLRKINLNTYLDIKEIWLRDVLKRNSVKCESIDEIIKFYK
ncbi:unnamed protein product [Didymodactylos carnosus]|uniref:Fungal lipase-type domain-containing protein n=1 Tax=Didymodactylos carnosus TaxID=1234261 RepID=A0A8S2P932_9BILA|nr:unnamed protein product [Didymodactylos carnosus]CAF4042689.1 unnamed protein product [Didymodactylos carnosus]